MTPPGGDANGDTSVDTSGGAERQTQLLRGALDMCMLALLAKEPAHGYELVRRLDEAGLDAGGYGTVYPLLTRMRRLGLLADHLQASPNGPHRKVYAVTPEGHRRLAAWTTQWTRFVETVNATLTAPGATAEGDNHDH